MPEAERVSQLGSGRCEVWREGELFPRLGDSTTGTAAISEAAGTGGF